MVVESDCHFKLTRFFTVFIGLSFVQTGGSNCGVPFLLKSTPEKMRAAAKLLRHTLHAHPGVSNREHETATRIIQFLKDYRGVSLVHQNVGEGAGLVFEVRGNAQQKGGKSQDVNSSSLVPGGIPTVLLRSDMDALPLVEASGLPHASTVPGVHHACGHDGHSAMLAAALARLSEDRDSWSGRVLGIFQPAEETGDGALQMITALPDVVGAPGINRGAFGIHNIPGAPLGQVLVRPEGTAARVSQSFDIHTYIHCTTF